MVVHNALVTRISESKNLKSVSGSSVIVDVNDVDEKLYVPTGKSLVVNGIEVKGINSVLTVEFGETSLADEHFSEPPSEAYVKIGEETIHAQGNSVFVGFNSWNFIHGEHEVSSIQKEVEIDLTHAKNGIAFMEGDQGQEVKVIEEFLLSTKDPQTGQSYLSESSVSSEGVYTETLAIAVAEWQSDYSINIDGKFGSESLGTAQALITYGGKQDIRLGVIENGDVLLKKEDNSLIINGREVEIASGEQQLILTDGETYRQVKKQTGTSAVSTIIYNEDSTSQDKTELKDNAVIASDETAWYYYGMEHIGQPVTAGLWIAEEARTLTGMKEESPTSVRFFDHYVRSSGEEIVLAEDEVPAEWKQFVVEYTEQHRGATEITTVDGSKKACEGTCYAAVDPYDKGLYDLQNSFGHFDVEVISNLDGSKTYTVTDTYYFAAKEEDPNKQFRHGFAVGDLSKQEVDTINELLPQTQIERTAGGYTEQLKLEKLEGTTYLFIPQGVLKSIGRPYTVRTSFTVPSHTVAQMTSREQQGG